MTVLQALSCVLCCWDACMYDRSLLALSWVVGTGFIPGNTKTQRVKCPVHMLLPSGFVVTYMWNPPLDKQEESPNQMLKALSSTLVPVFGLDYLSVFRSFLPHPFPSWFRRKYLSSILVCSIYSYYRYTASLQHTNLEQWSVMTKWMHAACTHVLHFSSHIETDCQPLQRKTWVMGSKSLGF